MNDFVLLLADNDHMDWDGGWWIVMVLGMALFWGLVIAGIVLIVRELGRRGQGERTGPGRDALATLDHRFAAGEISTEEYRDRRAVLRGEAPPP
jgi:putative membrane protein